MKNVAVAVVLLVTFLVGFRVLWTRVTLDEITVVVTEKDRECKNGEDCRYVIYTQNEVLENRDAFWFFKFNSSDVYAEIVPGRTYEMRVNGVRVRLLSWYRNIISVKETSP